MKYFSSMAVLGLLACATSAGAQETAQKIGFVDTARVYRESHEAKAINTSLEKEFSARQGHLAQLAQRGAMLQQKLQDDSLSDAQRQSVQQQLAVLNRQFVSERAQLAEDYSLRRNEQFAALQQKANQVILSISRKEHYDFLVTDVVYVNQKFDITDDVLKELNRY